MAVNKRAGRAGGTSAEAIGEGWRTTDSDEIERRRRRAREEKLRVRPLSDEPFGLYRVSSSSGRDYRVELRSRDRAINSCDCPDYEANGLGTCKHIEAVLLRRLPRGAVATRTEVYLDRRDQYGGGPVVRVLWAPALRANNKVRIALEPFFGSDSDLLGEPVATVPRLQRAVKDAGLGAERLRISAHLQPWLERLQREHRRRAARSRFVADVAAGKRDFNVLKSPLYEYQREGMLHLAFNERAMLADEMGLGKTVQAVAACELLRLLRRVQRVLVISPVSLKTEWEEQIARFSDQPTLIVQGSRDERLRQYRQDAFFYLANYEQVLADRDDMQRLLAPDIIVLDEAQRIKNWQAKTAQAVKRLTSPYVFVLTGTPLENRIDEIYSIAQVVDPHLFGPLFRFNRDFYQLDERGRPQSYKNLDELHRRLRPVLLRRRKSEVEGELPERTVNTYFVTMSPQQREPYEAYAGTVARLMSRARSGALSKDDFERLQQSLACMRMLCDSPYILDEQCRVSPKLEELKPILEELLGEPDNKVIIFSEWARMLDLLAEYARAAGFGYVLHTGKVRQGQRRAVINRFKDDPGCRLFLSSDAGATGLNLQVANVVINLDLPWNPAKLEQRIARAWRKHQRRRVSVINLVCEDSIEHRILHLLERKRDLADGVLDGGGPESLPMPSGRALLMAQLDDLLGTAVSRPERAADPQQLPLELEALPAELEAEYPNCLEELAVYEADGHHTLLAVVRDDVDLHRERLAQLLGRCREQTPLQPQVVDRQTMGTVHALADLGVLNLNPPLKSLHRSAHSEGTEAVRRRRQLEKARKQLENAQRKLRMAQVLYEGGFAAEAQIPLSEAFYMALSTMVGTDGRPLRQPVPVTVIRDAANRLEGLGFPTDPLLLRLRDSDQAASGSSLKQVGAVLQAVRELLDRDALQS